MWEFASLGATRSWVTKFSIWIRSSTRPTPKIHTCIYLSGNTLLSDPSLYPPKCQWLLHKVIGNKGFPLCWGFRNKYIIWKNEGPTTKSPSKETSVFLQCFSNVSPHDNPFLAKPNILNGEVVALAFILWLTGKSRRHEFKAIVGCTSRCCLKETTPNI